MQSALTDPALLAMQRTHPRERDLDWLPRGVRRARWLTSGVVWGGGAVATAAAVAVAPPLILAWKVLAAAGIGLAVGGDRAGRVLYHRQLRRLTRGEIPLAGLTQVADGEWVAVHGKIECAAPLAGILHGTPGVYRRLSFHPRGNWIHEAAVNFTLVDDHGQRIAVDAAGARWWIRDRETRQYPSHRLLSPDVPASVADLVRSGAGPMIGANEQVLPVGAHIRVVGYKSRVADVTGEVTDYRLPPQRPSIRSGKDLPVVLVPLEDGRK